jgi:hypothetical protein
MLEEKLVFVKSFKDESCDVMMLFHGLCEDEDVVKVDTDNSFHDEVLENVIHHGLEGGGRVSESKKHHQGFKEAPFVRNAAFHSSPSFMDIVVTPPYIKFSEVLRAPRSWLTNSEMRGRGYRFLIVKEFKAQ